MSAVVLVAARAANGVIGRDGALPWRLPADLAHFKALTWGKPVLMGRRTFESIGRALPGRRNLVLTRDPRWRADGAEAFGGLAGALAAVAGEAEAMVIGGAQVYRAALPLADRIEMTEVHAEFEGDTRFPAFDAARWRETRRETHRAAGGRPGFSFTTLVRA